MEERKKAYALLSSAMNHKKLSTGAKKHNRKRGKKQNAVLKKQKRKKVNIRTTTSHLVNLP